LVEVENRTREKGCLFGDAVLEIDVVVRVAGFREITRKDTQRTGDAEERFGGFPETVGLAGRFGACFVV